MSSLVPAARRTLAPATRRREAAALAALAPNSRRLYLTAWHGWEAWSRDHGTRTLPATPEAVTDCLVDLHKAGKAHPTLTMARAAIAKWHAVHNVPDPTGDGLVKDTLRRLRRESRDRGRGQARPLDPDTVTRIATELQRKGSVTALRDAALLLVASDTLARRSAAPSWPRRRLATCRSWSTAAARC